MNSFTETRFDIGIIPPSSGGPGFRTSITKVGSGFEKRVPARTQILFQGDVGKLLLTEKEVAYVIAFFNARRGRAIGFRYKYLADYKCTHDAVQVSDFTQTQGVATLPPQSSSLYTPNNNVYQLQKKYTNFRVDSFKDIYKPVQGTVKVYVNGTLQQSGISVNYQRGIVEFDSAPGTSAVVTWDGEFDLPCRFDSDKLPGATEFIDPTSKEIVFRFDSLPIIETIESPPVAYSYVARTFATPAPAPTPSPTPSPTPAPTPSPTGVTVKIVGDMDFGNNHNPGSYTTVYDSVGTTSNKYEVKLTGSLGTNNNDNQHYYHPDVYRDGVYFATADGGWYSASVDSVTVGNNPQSYNSYYATHPTPETS